MVAETVAGSEKEPSRGYFMGDSSMMVLGSSRFGRGGSPTSKGGPYGTNPDKAAEARHESRLI